MRSCSLLIQWADSIRYSDDPGRSVKYQLQIIKSVQNKIGKPAHQKYLSIV